MRATQLRRFASLRWLIFMSIMASSALAQQSANPPAPPVSPSANSSADSLRELRDQVRELQAAVAEMRSDWQQSRSETAELRRELDQLRASNPPRPAILRTALANSLNAVSDLEVGTPQNGSTTTGNDAPEKNEDPTPNAAQKETGHAASLEEEYQLLSGKVDDQYQTKVESASKYRLRLSGIVLMNLASNQGKVDSIDLPMLSYPVRPGNSGGSFGATLRQSQIGFEAFGPTVAGAKTRADLQLDLAGGFPSVPNGINSGLLRLRTATMRMDWTKTSIVVGQDSLFFSPNSPTSFASLAVPAFSSAGNLWGWIPQIRVEHRVSLGDRSTLLFQGGILDPVAGELPATTSGTQGDGGYYRQAGPGEASRQPAYATRIAWTRNLFGQPLRLGVGAFYSRQDYGFNRNVDGWAAMSDIDLPLSSRFSLSGKLYRGKALGGLYGGIGRSVLFSGDPTLASTQIQALNSIGGWAQLKYRPANKWEFNGAFGMDNPYATDLEYFPYSQSYGDPDLSRNKGSFGNVIYRPRSDLLFSVEYRHITTYTINNGSSSAGQLNLMMGVLF
jgi:hypothetical protein